MLCLLPTCTSVPHHPVSFLQNVFIEWDVGNVCVQPVAVSDMTHTSLQLTELLTMLSIWCAGAIKAAGNCPADVSTACPSGNFGFNNTGGCGNVGCNNMGTGNIGNNNSGTGNKGDNNNGSNNVGRCLDGTDQTGDEC